LGFRQQWSKRGKAKTAVAVFSLVAFEAFDKSVALCRITNARYGGAGSLP
jgi:hypothetical protein